MPEMQMMTRSVLEDGSLAVRAGTEAWAVVDPWMPRVPPEEPAAERARAWIEVALGAPAFDPPAGEPIVQMASVLGWAVPGDRMLLHGGRVSAVLDLPALRADVRLLPPEPWTEAFRLDLFAGLTLAAAFLLGRLARTLVHAGAVVAPDGRAWLLVGGSFSGKSTTCVNLIRGGWDWLSDDHVVLRELDGDVWVEGWPRRFNLDHGYARGVSEGVRGRVDPDGFGPGRWRRAAPLGGLLFPRVEAALPTVLEPASGADALSALVRQSPWLLADPHCAGTVLALLQRTARRPRHALRLGMDSYRNPEQIIPVIAPAAANASNATPAA